MNDYWGLLKLSIFKMIQLWVLTAVLYVLVMGSPVLGQGLEPTNLAEQRVDLARFAQVVTCNPDRIRGTLATRADEFPEEDLFLESELAAS